MIKVSKIIELSNKASKHYLNKEGSLNNYLIKEAIANDLTPEEIQRVVEFTNTKTYLDLRDESKNKYVSFDLADAGEITKMAHKDSAPTLKKSSSYKSHSDYNRPPSTKMEKVAEDGGDTPLDADDEKMFMSREVPSYNKQFMVSTDVIGSNSQKYDDRITTLAAKVRQLLLKHKNIDDVKSLVMSIDISGTIWESIKLKLQDEFPFIKNASVLENRVLDTQTSLYKEVSELEKIASELVDQSVMLGAVISSFEKSALRFKTPLKLMGLAAGLGAAFVAGSNSQKTKRSLHDFDNYTFMKQNGDIK